MMKAFENKFPVKYPEKPQTLRMIRENLRSRSLERQVSNLNRNPRYIIWLEERLNAGMLLQQITYSADEHSEYPRY